MKKKTRKGEKLIVLEDGTEQLLPTHDLASTLAATDNAMREADAARTAARLDAVTAKRESLASGDAVPDDKRPV